MMTINARNVNDAYNNGLYYMKVSAAVERSRNGLCMVAPGPVLTRYACPWERVLFDEARNANPFFHLAEAIWMLAGEQDVKWLAKFNKGMLQYSDDGARLNGAYGFRWRRYWDHDQLIDTIRMLRRKYASRQVVMAMWDPDNDMDSASKDVPCNTHIYFRRRDRDLDITVCCRSNDLVWGAYGANAVHFSFLHEFMAQASGLRQGFMYQFSNNFHIYDQHWPLMEAPVWEGNPYLQRDITTTPLFRESEDYPTFLDDCSSIVNGGDCSTEFMRKIAQPLLRWYLDRADEPPFLGLHSNDWVVAARAWMDNRGKP